MLTIPQVTNQTKLVTRRDGWWNVKVGEYLILCEKCMGLKKGEHVRPLEVVEVVAAYPEPLSAITQDECKLEGFPHLTPEQFIEMFCRTHKNCTPDKIINRIQFRYIHPKNGD